MANKKDNSIIFKNSMYAIRILNHLDKIPFELRNDIFNKLFEIADITKRTEQEKEDFDERLKYYRDWKNLLDTAREEGIAKGIEIGKAVINALILGKSDAHILEITGLTQEKLDYLKAKIKDHGKNE